MNYFQEPELDSIAFQYAKYMYVLSEGRTISNIELEQKLEIHTTIDDGDRRGLIKRLRDINLTVIEDDGNFFVQLPQAVNQSRAPQVVTPLSELPKGDFDSAWNEAADAIIEGNTPGPKEKYVDNEGNEWKKP